MLRSYEVITCFGEGSSLVHGRNFSGKDETVQVPRLSISLSPHVSLLLGSTLGAALLCSSGWMEDSAAVPQILIPTALQHYKSTPERNGVSILMRSLRLHIHCMSCDCLGTEMTNVPANE